MIFIAKITLLVALFTGCSSSLKYQKYSHETSLGHYEKKMDRDVYQVFANFPAGTSDYTANRYLDFRVGELCLKSNKKFWHSTRAIKLDELKHKWDKKSVVGFCFKEQLRPALEFVISDEGNVIHKIVNPVTSKLKVGDQILQIGNNKVSSLTQIKIAIHKTGLKNKTIKMKVNRKGTTVNLRQPIEPSDALNGPSDFKRFGKMFL